MSNWPRRHLDVVPCTSRLQVTGPIVGALMSVRSVSHNVPPGLDPDWPNVMLQDLHHSPSYTIEELVEIGARAVLIARYSSIAVYTVQVYDWLLTLGEERRLIHQRRWSSVKIAFLFCRYYPLLGFPVYLWFWVGDHDLRYCRPVIHPLYAFIVPFLISAQAVILIRVYAFAGRSRKVLCILCLCLTALFAVQLWLYGSQYVLVEEIYILLPRTGCFGTDQMAEMHAFVQKPSSQAGFVMLGACLMDFLMTTIMILHCIRIRSTQGPLGKEFVAQGVAAFALTSALNLLVAVVLLIPERQYNGIGLPFAMVLPDIIACRLILLLRARVSKTESYELKHQSILVRQGLEALETERENEPKHGELDDWT